jgi:hypothetical protein
VTSEIHDRSRPFTGAVFDTIVDGFHARLVAEGLADERLLALDIRDVGGRLLEDVTALTAAAFASRQFLFRSALAEARDEVATTLARAWPTLSSDGLYFEDAAMAICEAADGAAPGLAARFEENFVWREIISSNQYVGGAS